MQTLVHTRIAYIYMVYIRMWIMYAYVCTYIYIHMFLHIIMVARFCLWIILLVFFFRLPSLTIFVVFVGIL